MSTKAGKQVLNMELMQEDFFEETALVGIVSAQPAYRLCWLINNHFDINFIRDPEQVIDFKKKTETIYFAIYLCELPNSSNRYLLYQLKNNGTLLLPETKNLDYLWYIQAPNPEDEAANIVRELRNIPEIQLAQILDPEKIPSLNNLII